MNRVQTLRSSVAGNRPANGTRAVGEIYVNFPDLQLGCINPALAAQDLLAVRNFSATASYVAGDIIVQGGQIWTATGPVAPGAFNPAQWQSVSAASVTVNDVAPASPHQGDLWYDSVGGQMYCWYDDGSSAQWVIAVNNAPDLTNYATLNGATFTGPVTLPAGSIVNGYAPLAGATFTGPVNGTTAGFSGAANIAGTITGNANLSIAGNAVFGADAKATGFTTDNAIGSARYIRAFSAGVPRWVLNVANGNAETGSSNGSDFSLDAYTDAGALLYPNVMVFYRGTGVFQIAASTANKGVAGPWAATSDARIKNIVSEYKHGLDEVLQLEPVVFTFKGNDDGPDQPSIRKSLADAKTPFIGLIAQAVEPVMPECVTKKEGYIDGEQVTDLRELDIGPLTFALINAIKELKAEIDALKGGTRK